MSLLKTTGWLFPLIFLAGCDGASHDTVSKTVVTGVALPALPIIQNAVMALVPIVDGQRNDWMMRQVCALARGESSQEQVNQALRQRGIELNNIPKQGHPLSLLVDPDMSQRATACAAYIATSVMSLPKTSEFMVEAKTEAHETEKAQKLSIDPQKLKHFLDIQIAVVKADADLFALIATELEKNPGLTLDQYNSRAKSLFATIAPAYLQQVKDFYGSDQNTEYTLLEYSDSDFKFRSNSGLLFEYGYDGLNLSVNRIPWYGEGKLLGKTYLLDVAYFDPKWMKIIGDAGASEKGSRGN
jgi:hypothetical protein